MEKKNKTLNLSQMTLSHEFRSPLNSCLMLLESLLSRVVDQAIQKMILVLITQINLLICLVNDILDMKMIDEDKFVTRQEAFNPTKTFKFMLSVFA